MTVSSYTQKMAQRRKENQEAFDRYQREEREKVEKRRQLQRGPLGPLQGTREEYIRLGVINPDSKLTLWDLRRGPIVLTSEDLIEQAKAAEARFLGRTQRESRVSVSLAHA